MRIIRHNIKNLQEAYSIIQKHSCIFAKCAFKKIYIYLCCTSRIFLWENQILQLIFWDSENKWWIPAKRKKEPTISFDLVHAHQRSKGECKAQSLTERGNGEYVTYFHEDGCNKWECCGYETKTKSMKENFKSLSLFSLLWCSGLPCTSEILYFPAPLKTSVILKCEQTT